MAFFVFAPLLASTLGNSIPCSKCRPSGGTGCDGDNIDIIAIESTIAFDDTQQTRIDSFQFWTCSNIRNVIVSNTVEIIGESAFADSDITSVVIPASVITIQIDAFSSAVNLATVTFGDGSSITTIEKGVFITTPALTSITLPSSIVEIEEDAFRESGLTSIHIPESVTEIKTNAFKDTSDLKSVSIPYGATIHSTAFSNSGCPTVTYSAGLTMCNCVTTDTSCFQFECTGCGTPSVDSKCADASNILAEPAGGTTVIANDAFDSCGNIQSVTVKSDTMAIGDRAFYTTGVTSIEIPKSVKSIGVAAFGWPEENFAPLSTITFESDSELTSIGEGAFSKTSLTSIEIPQSVTTIGTEAFESTADLATVTFGAESVLQEIGGSAFRTSGLTSIEIPQSVTTIGEGAFMGTDSMTSITFAGTSQLIAISVSMFQNAVALESIEIPASVQTIAERAFTGDEALTSVTFADNSLLTEIGQAAFNGCNSLNLVKIPDSVTTIGISAFRGGTNKGVGRRGLLQAGPGVTGSLDSVSIPATATVGDGAFANQACDETLYEPGTTMCGCDTTDDSCFLEGGAPTEAPTEAAPPLSPVAITGIALGSVVGAVAIGYISYGAYTASGSGSTESGQKLLSSTYL